MSADTDPIERIAADLWERRRGSPWVTAGAFWQALYRELAAVHAGSFKNDLTVDWDDGSAP